MKIRTSTDPDRDVDADEDGQQHNKTRNTTDHRPPPHHNNKRTQGHRDAARGATTTTTTRQHGEAGSRPATDRPGHIDGTRTVVLRRTDKGEAAGTAGQVRCRCSANDGL